MANQTANGELSAFMGHWLPQIEIEMRSVLNAGDAYVTEHYSMMRYHLGWADREFQPVTLPSGKRLRPILCLLACSEIGGDTRQVLPAAAGIELLHNFSLVHDDIEDGDEVRRHRPTVWSLWGMPQAINVGDGMFTLSFLALHRLTSSGVEADVALSALQTFSETSLALTEGQYLDMSFETRDDVSVDEYMRMIRGKTAALVGACLSIGSLVGGADAVQRDALTRFGISTGLAFQIQDDILGIWGDPEVTGKAAGNDILRRKKSLPILHALNHAEVGEQVRAQFDGEVEPDQLPRILALIETAGTREYAETLMRRQHDAAVEALEEALGERAGASPLMALADSLLGRTS